MNGLKKMLGTLLAVLMVAGSALTSFAMTYDDVKEDDAAKTEISILSDIGVIKGTSENEFSPNDPVTREQMAALLFRLMLGRDDAGRVNTTDFRDLYEPYYNGAISWANAAGYILGVSTHAFNPTGGITKQDAMTMLVRALGQDDDKMNAGYPWTYINAAVKLGLDRGLEKVAYTDTLTRAETAVILYNALTSDYLVARKLSNGSVIYESSSIIEEVFGYSMADAMLTATNDYALDGMTVVKNGHVTLLARADGKTFVMTVPADAMNLDDDANDQIGRTFRVIYQADGGKYTVLSAVPMTNPADYDRVEINHKNGTVKIGGVAYTLVEDYSDELATNNNELILYAVNADGSLTVVENLDELESRLGFIRVTVMTDGETGRIAVMRQYKLGQLLIDDKDRVNLADNKALDDVKLVNRADAKKGDYVLYRYNEKNEELEIDAVLEVKAGTVTRLTNDSAKIGGETYALGKEDAGIMADSIREQLALGEDAAVILYQDAVVAVLDGAKPEAEASRYLIAANNPERVYENGKFRYILTAYVDGVEKVITVEDGSAKRGYVYRYLETDGVYTLISPSEKDGVIVHGADRFVQKDGRVDEIAYIINNADGTTITSDTKNIYTLNPGKSELLSTEAKPGQVKFICDDDTVIVLRENGRITRRTGAYASTIEITEGSAVIAILNNEVGALETLRFLYISDGSFGSVEMDAEAVRVLALNGLVYENGAIYAEYEVFNFAEMKVETRLSTAKNLEIGADYRCTNDGLVTAEKTTVMKSGTIGGFTAGTVTIDDEVYARSADLVVIRVTADHKVEEVRLVDLFEKEVEYLTENGRVTFIMEVPAEQNAD